MRIPLDPENYLIYNSSTGMVEEWEESWKAGEHEPSSFELERLQEVAPEEYKKYISNFLKFKPMNKLTIKVSGSSTSDSSTSWHKLKTLLPKPVFSQLVRDRLLKKTSEGWQIHKSAFGLFKKVEEVVK